MPEDQFKTIEDFLSPEDENTSEENTSKQEENTPEENTFKQDEGTPKQEEKTPEEENTPKQEEEEPKQEEGTSKQEEGTPKQKPNPMRELRNKAQAATKLQEKIDSAINRMSDGDYKFKLKEFKGENGKIDYDALIAAMDEADIKDRAETKGITPEVQAEIEKYEKEKKEVEIAKARVHMDRQLNNFQMEQQLNSEDLNNFISDAMQIGINPLSIAALDRTSKGTTALKMLYKAVYIDKITKDAVDKALEEAEAKRQKDIDAKDKTPKSNPAGPNNSKTNEKNPKGIALDDFLKTL